MLIGEKVGLRPVAEADLPLIARWRNHPRTRTKFLTTLLIPVSGQKKWYEKLLNDPTRIQFMIVRLEDNVTVGTIGLNHIDYRNQSFEPCALIIDPEQRGQHLGVDAIRVMLRYAFEELNLQRAASPTLPYNKSAIRWYEELGFKEEGIARKAVYINGQFHDVIHHAMLREEWHDDLRG